MEKSRCLAKSRRCAVAGVLRSRRAIDCPPSDQQTSADVAPPRRRLHHVDAEKHEAYVGSNNQKALWHELGTSRIPPRPFLATAAAAKHAEIGELIGQKFHALLVKA
jgi:hypothetical protein